jgi:hypothetical protein
LTSNSKNKPIHAPIPHSPLFQESEPIPKKKKNKIKNVRNVLNVKFKNKLITHHYPGVRVDSYKKAKKNVSNVLSVKFKKDIPPLTSIQESELIPTKKKPKKNVNKRS